MSDRLPILCLDFDGVLHSYSSGWQGADVIPDPPVPGAIGFLCEATKSFRVAIYSSRSHQSNGIEAMRFWLRIQLTKLMEPEDVEHYLSLIDFPMHKPAAMVTLDDRAITFTGVWPAIAELRTFSPWNKKERPT